MKVFISWSGKLSHGVALVFRDWLPSVIQSLEPYVSSEDIDKGTRWSSEMAQELEKSKYGIICVTKDNVGEPWINFEAGALSKSIERSAVSPFSSAVSPFLFDLKPADLEGPLTQFQYVVREKNDILKLVSSINGKVDSNQLPPEKLEKAFERWWPDLDQAFTKIAQEGGAGIGPKARSRKPEEILDELLELVRAQQRQMVSKEDFSALLDSIRLEIMRTVGTSALYGVPTPGSVFRSVITGGGAAPSEFVNLANLGSLSRGPTNEVATKTPDVPPTATARVEGNKATAKPMAEESHGIAKPREK